MQRSNEAKTLVPTGNWRSAVAFASLFLLVAGHWSLVAATSVTGTIKDPAGTGINGSLTLELSAPGRVNDPALLLIQPKVTCAITNGAIAPGCTVRGNDTILEPAGTFYCVRIVASGGKELMAGRKYTVTGSTVDLGAAEPGANCK